MPKSGYDHGDAADPTRQRKAGGAVSGWDSKRGQSSDDAVSRGPDGVPVPEASGVSWDPKPASTRQRLVETARQLFLVNGYEATGVAEILREAGVNSGSLYYFFKTKEELLLAVLDQYVEMLHPCVIDPVFAKVGDPIERVFAVLEGYRQMLLMTDCRQGCPIGNLALEMSEKSEAVQEKIALNFANWRKAITQCLVDASGRLPAGTDPEKLSTFVLSVMEGAVMQARAHRSIEPFDASVTVLREYFNREGGPPPVEVGD